jgi:methionyl-tRNA formyltransferase
VIYAGNIVSPTVLAAGFKGVLFVTGLLEAGIRPLRIVSYPQQDDRFDSFNRLIEISRSRGIELEESRHPHLTKDSLAFLVGWQFLLRDGLGHCIVFHDSLLPKLRGFTPTVTALLLGSETIGVTAIRPDNGKDSGLICGQRIIKISHDTSVRNALVLQSRAMVDLAIEILQSVANGTLVERKQDQDGSTFSLWRDKYDYFIDWRISAAEIQRFVQALGFPYDGAKGVIDEEIITIKAAACGPELAFAIRDPGKLWQVEGRRALVVCGSGTLWIEEACDPDGTPFQFKHLRKRFLTPDNAWIAPVLRTTKIAGQGN